MTDCKEPPQSHRSQDSVSNQYHQTHLDPCPEREVAWSAESEGGKIGTGWLLAYIPPRFFFSDSSSFGGLISKFSTPFVGYIGHRKFSSKTSELRANVEGPGSVSHHASIVSKEERNFGNV